MKLPGVALSVCEQALASAFTFFLFWTAARLLDSEALQLYTTLFSLNQSFAFFLFGLVLLPMASASGESAPKQLGISVALLGALLLAFAVLSPFAMRTFPSLQGRVTPELWLLSIAFFGSQCAFEAARWLTIRLRGARAAVVVTLARFVLFFAIVLSLATMRLDATDVILAQVAVNVLAALGFGAVMRGMLHEVRLVLPDRSALRNLSQLGTSAGSFLTNFVTVALVDRGLGETGLAAFQALRSATNPIGLLSQVMDNHFSAEVARSGRNVSPTGRAFRAALIAAAALLLLATLLGRQLVELLFGAGLARYWILLPLLLLASLAHALTRPIFVAWRVTGDTRALNTYSLLLIAVVAPALALLGWSGWTLLMIAVFALLPLTAVAVSLLTRSPPSAEPSR